MIVYKLKFVGDGEFIIISPPILHRLIEKVKMSSEKELSVDIDRLFPRSYQEYLLNVINSNSDEPYFSYEYITKTPLDQKDLFKVAEHQLEDIKIVINTRLVSGTPSWLVNTFITCMPFKSIFTCSLPKKAPSS